MKGAYPPEYIDKVINQRDGYGGLGFLAALLDGSEQFDRDLPMAGLPPSMYLFYELLMWFAQSLRSGTWTYYETRLVARQEEMASLLAQNAEFDFAESYASGMRTWFDPDAIKVVDVWLEANEERGVRFLWDWIARHRSDLNSVVACPDHCPGILGEIEPGVLFNPS